MTIKINIFAVTQCMLVYYIIYRYNKYINVSITLYFDSPLHSTNYDFANTCQLVFRVLVDCLTSANNLF